MNSRIQKVKARSHGFRNAIYVHLSDLNLYPDTKEGLLNGSYPHKFVMRQINILDEGSRKFSVETSAIVFSSGKLFSSAEEAIQISVTILTWTIHKCSRALACSFVRTKSLVP